MHDRPRVPTLSLTRIVLSCGRSVELTELRLTPTYGDMPAGYPCRPVNDLRIRALLHTAAGLSPTVPVHLIPPSREYPDQYAGAFGPSRRSRAWPASAVSPPCPWPRPRTRSPTAPA